MTSITPTGRMRDIFDEYGWNMAGTAHDELEQMIDELDVATEPWLLVEISRYDKSPFYTLHASRDAAHAYNITQEYPNDWYFEFVVDLTCGDRYVPSEVTVVSWENT